MNAETLKMILEKIPDDYEIRFQDNIIRSNVEVDVENKRLILK